MSSKSPFTFSRKNAILLVSYFVVANISPKKKLIRALRWSEKYTKTDMVYFASGNFWLTISRVIGIGSGLLLTIAFANLISPTIFGTYKYILAVAGIVGAFSLNGINGAVIRTIAQGNQNIIRPVFWTNVKWSLPASAAALMGALYYFIQGNEVLGVGLLLIAISNPFFNGFVITKALFIGKKDFKTNALYKIPSSLFSTLSIITVLLLTKNIFFILIVYFFSNFITAWLIYGLSLKKYSIEKSALLNQDTRDKVKDTVTFGKHLSVMGAFMQVVGYIDQLLLWHFVGPVQLAMYMIAQGPIKEIRNLSESFLPVVFPKLVTKSIADIKKTMPLRLLQVFSVSAVIAVSYILIAPFLFKFLFPQYLGSVFPSQLLAIAILFQAKGLLSATFDAHAMVREKYISVFSTTMIRLLFTVTLIPFYGIMGAVLAIILSELTSTIILLFLYKKVKAV